MVGEAPCAHIGTFLIIGFFALIHWWDNGAYIRYVYNAEVPGWTYENYVGLTYNVNATTRTVSRSVEKIIHNSRIDPPCNQTR